MITIHDENELPAPEMTDFIPAKGTSFRYLRHLIDPRVLIETANGACYARRDGMKWPNSGYIITREQHGGISRSLGAGLADFKEYPLEKQLAGAA